MRILMWAAYGQEGVSFNKCFNWRVKRIGEDVLQARFELSFLFFIMLLMITSSPISTNRVLSFFKFSFNL